MAISVFKIGFFIWFYSVRLVFSYQIGTGIADCTGPAAEVIFMGYAKLTQVGCGLHLRQFARAYIVDDGTNRVAFVTVDAQSMTHGIRREVLKNLADVYGDIYSEQNLILSGTHTHGTPGGFMEDVMMDISILGFNKQTFDALVDGISIAIIKAHETMTEGKIYINSGELLDANINRSPASYLQNPDEERAKYEYNVDKELVQLKFVSSDTDEPIGAINWFAVHPTSMNNTNCLVTSDNVGYASILLESHLNQGIFLGEGPFVGAFASTNLGDVSPNIKGPICIDTGKECDFLTSTCNGSTATCIASGPGDNMYESTKIIAGRLFEKAKELFHSEDATEVTGPVKFIHQFVDMPNQRANITLYNGTQIEVHGCRPGMGYSFAGGTTDGPGEFDFTQGTVTDNPFWDLVRDFLFPPTEEDIACHHPKPLLIFTGDIDFPYQWQAKIVPTQILMIGEVALVAVPGEFTTMSGRRLREAVTDVIVSNGGSEKTRSIITGLSSTYTNYIATPEEYQIQRYEGGSTIYGPHTLTLYIEQYKKLAEALMKDEPLDPGPTPPDFSSQLISLVFPPSVDTAPENATFGDVLEQPADPVTINETVVAKFVSGNPRHNLLLGDSYLFIDMKENEETWNVVLTDAHWSTRYHWARTGFLSSESVVTIEWDVDENVAPGIYRIRHQGHYKTDSEEIVWYEGITAPFTVVQE